MSFSESNVEEHSDHSFGGTWTEIKLGRLKAYLEEYAKIMSKKKFRFAYIDAFAGTGYITREKQDISNEIILFEDLAGEEPQEFLSGSVKVALEVMPIFSKYIFIEKEQKHFLELQKTCNEYLNLENRIQIINADANTYLQDLCNNYSWKKNRAVLFLDPYGMQVEWKTVQAIAATRAIDLWLLFPLGMSITRMLTSDGSMPQSWTEKLDTFFGTHEWWEEFYKERVENTIFGDKTVLQKCCDYKTISRYFVKRLKNIFPHVAENPLTLCNSKNIPLFLLCFAAGNEKGGAIAKKIAEYILSMDK